MQPLAIDLYCGLGGWAEGLLAEGWRVIGYDIVAHDYGTGGYPGELRLEDVTTLNGAEFADAQLIVASPPCQAYSYRAMPWKRTKALPPPDNTLFDACWRIQAEAIVAAGHYIPMIVENVRGAVKWVSQPVRWHYGSYYLWGDVPALMPITVSGSPGEPVAQKFNPGAGTLTELRTWVLNNRRIEAKGNGSWFGNYREAKAAGRGSANRYTSSGSPQRKAASAAIAKIPLPLALHIARCFKPEPKMMTTMEEP